MNTLRVALAGAAILILAACSSPTAPHRAPAVQPPSHDVLCWDPSRSGYIVYAGDKCPPL